MKRVGLIDNLSNIDAFLADGFQHADAAQVMVATGGNTGNVAFVFGTRKIINNPLVRVGWGWDPKIVRERFDHLVICCANQIGSHVDLGGWADRLDHFDLPVTLVGLGAQADDYGEFPKIPEGTIRFLNLVGQRQHSSACPNIAVRGLYTQRVLAEIGVRSVAAGCPSLMIAQTRQLGEKIFSHQGKCKFKKVAVAAGNPWHVASARLERVLVEIVDCYHGDYMLQHPESMLQFAFGEFDKISEKTVAHFLSVYGNGFDMESLFDWYRRNACVFVDAPNWMRFLSRFDAVVGPRYHGVALGVQAGIPGCVVTIDSRTQELCDTTAIKNLHVSKAVSMRSDELVESTAWTMEDVNLFDVNRTKLARTFVEMLMGNGLEPSESLIALSE